MSRIASVIALLAILLTGVLIGQMRQFRVSSVEPVPARSGDSGIVTDRFYAAIEHLLRTGDAAPLRDVTSPDYVEHRRLDRDPGTRETLERDLVALRAQHPEIRIAAERLTEDRELVASQVRLSGIADPMLAGVPVDLPRHGPGYELLRIQGKRVVERWTGSPIPGHVREVAVIDDMSDSQRARRPVLERLMLAPLATFDDRSHLGAVVIVESGSLRLREGDADVEAERLEPGDVRAFAPGAEFALWNIHRESAMALIFSIRSFSPASAFGSETAQAGVGRTAMTGGSLLKPAAGAMSLRAGHSVAAPGTAIRRHAVEGAEVLMVVEGRVEVAVADGYVWMVEDTGLLAMRRETFEIGAGHAVATDAGSEVSYTVTGDGPAEFWYFTVMPGNGR
jgi:mannose-6-phosphate isomerase-like protein (cupin superfamily)